MRKSILVSGLVASLISSAVASEIDSRGLGKFQDSNSTIKPGQIAIEAGWTLIGSPIKDGTYTADLVMAAGVTEGWLFNPERNEWNATSATNKALKVTPQTGMWVKAAAASIISTPALGVAPVVVTRKDFVLNKEVNTSTVPKTIAFGGYPSVPAEELKVVQGWNLVSLPVPQAMNPNLLLGLDTTQAINLMWFYEDMNLNANQLAPTTQGWKKCLRGFCDKAGDILPVQGFWIKADKNASIYLGADSNVTPVATLTQTVTNLNTNLKVNPEIIKGQVVNSAFVVLKLDRNITKSQAGTYTTLGTACVAVTAPLNLDVGMNPFGTNITIPLAPIAANAQRCVLITEKNATVQGYQLQLSK